MSHDLTPCLWFRDEAEAAARFYVGLFPGSGIGTVLEGAPGTPPIAVPFTIDGHPFLALNGNPEPGFSNSVSLMVNCDTQAEIDRLWDALGDGGRTMACGWLADRFGVVWQICPRRSYEWLTTGTPAQRRRAMAAMQTMVKFDLAAMEAAHAQEDVNA
jgi:predicted 3-demethylubiquinone-9 3-methyltransferase (glyoxalase superfamily)